MKTYENGREHASAHFVMKVIVGYGKKKKEADCNGNGLLKKYSKKK